MTAERKAPSAHREDRAPRHRPTRKDVDHEMYVTIEEVAQSLRVTVPTVRWLRQECRFAPAIKVGRRVLWDEEALTAWLEANREAPVR